ncbi:hypothetical protein Pst134EA_013753 [Puccinia striiformis f. sp. tritici]|uniref:hypothetical protein n=1 Tax=Puccinia striiformis f. sp. tritici TaxID=168172 RepID=UPI0020086A3B|nr:hypothetical protein Pst134EA_013753 [Puccinia striiformis f. sp. tritici]KAH9465893.1 hypothetical protein Pst134EA_013753 [Puccinia striiformis f. sp. tritici]
MSDLSLKLLAGQSEESKHVAIAVENVGRLSRARILVTNDSLSETPGTSGSHTQSCHPQKDNSYIPDSSNHHSFLRPPLAQFWFLSSSSLYFVSWNWHFRNTSFHDKLSCPVVWGMIAQDFLRY